MNTFNLFLLLPALAFSLGCSAQMKNSRTVHVRIDGDCPMCETRIEAVGSVKNEAKVDWVVETHMASVTYDSTRTDLDVILQRVAHAGYDTERFLAPKEAYDKLPGCCQYERTMVHAPLKGDDAHAMQEHAEGEAHAETMEQDGATDDLQPVFDAYFTLKDALVASDAEAAAGMAQAYAKALDAVQMDALDHATQMVWMKVMGPLQEQAQMIAGAKVIEAQRKAFAKLTDPMAELAMASPRAEAIYRDHCPMYEGGADWLSKEKPIKNPFYGSMMMTCGSVKETIAK